jgi:hypothetical protein
MAHLWVRERSGEWVVARVSEEPFVLDRRILRPAGWFELSERARRERDLLDLLDRKIEAPAASIRRADRSGQETWLLLALPWRVIVNGVPVTSGLHVLDDRDDIRVGGLEPAFFSTERLARTESCPDSGRRLICPRCRQEVAAGTPAVCCPACGIWHHQADDLMCWTYADRCALCPQTTSLDAGYQWTPEDL